MEIYSLQEEETEFDLLLRKRLEAILFVSNQSVTLDEMIEVTGADPGDVKSALAALGSHYRDGGHGLELVQLAGGWQICTVPEVADVVELFRDTAQRQKVRLSRAALETLAVVAYNQPVIRSEIEEIRGVRCERVIETLLNHGLIRIAGRKKGTGSPLLYRSTGKFLNIFGLNAISDLPTIREIEELRSEESDMLLERSKASVDEVVPCEQ